MKKTLLTILTIWLILGLNGYAGTNTRVPTGYKSIGNKSPIYKKYNQYTGTTFYTHKDLFPKEHGGSFTINKAKHEQEIRTIAIFYYAGKNWIFFNRATIVNTEGKKISFKIESSNKKTRVMSSGKVKERGRIHLSKEDIVSLQEVLNSSSVDMRLSGKFYHDKSFSKSEIKNLLEILNYNP